MIKFVILKPTVKVKRPPMAKNNSLFIKLGLLAGAVLLFAGAKAAQLIGGLAITFQRVSLAGSVVDPRALITLKVQNPSPLGITLQSLQGRLLYDQQFLANVKTTAPVKIEPGAAVFFDLEAQTTLKSALDIIGQFLTKKIKNRFFFDGTVRVGGIDLPIKQKLEF